MNTFQEIFYVNWIININIIYNIPASASAGNAVISFGKNNYKHPNQEYIDSLFKKKFTICKTNEDADGIHISL
jgi:aspartate carbamoyltransferase catalytic subunit